ncbi:MAG: alpha-2-macroglobulin [Spirochaetales bacterium]|nr:alpha-2-macroglobulin [Spirochaetales bacterium]
MKKTMRNALIRAGLFAAAILVVASCAPKEFKPSTPDSSILSGFTTGVVSASSSIVFRFVNEIATADRINVPVKDSYFAFDPGIDGVTAWSDTHTLEFRPNQKLKSGQKYLCRLFLGKVLKNEAAGEFRFIVNVIEQNFELTLDNLRITDRRQTKNLVLPGAIQTADAAAGEDVEKIIAAAQEGKSLAIEWTHAANNNRHEFVITGVTRRDAASAVTVSFDGRSIGAEKNGTTTVDVPSIKNFEVLGVSPVKDHEQYVEVTFSDPVKPGQDLRGLISIAGQPNLRFQIDSNVVRIYNLSNWPAEVNVTVRPGIANTFGDPLRKGASEKVVFQMLEPQVKFLGKGTILPTTNGLTLPIESCNVKAVTVEAVYVYEDNMEQFFQVNRYYETREMARVGRPVWKQIVSLNWDSAKRNRWVRSGLDLTELTRKYPKGLYRLTISFTHDQVDYPCAGQPGAEFPESKEGTGGYDFGQGMQDSSYWDYYESGDYNYWDYYNQRKNPCHPAYYFPYNDHNVSISRNVLISDIGLIAKKGPDNTLLVIATDIKTAAPLSGVSLDVLNYQKQSMVKGGTDANGLSTLACNGVPYLLVASKDDQKGYLRLDPATSLSVSQFDVAGEASRKGLKGFIYGERGVWRPGDPIYLTFILLDTLKTLPANHPVILKLINPRGQTAKTVTQTISENGFYHFKLQTDPESPTGDWLARIMVGGETFEKALKIETIMPNRLKISLDFGANVKYLSSGVLSAKLAAAWLHGAPAGGLKAEVKASFAPRVTAFKGFPDFTFDDPSRAFTPSVEDIYDGSLDENGKAVIQTSLEGSRNSPGMLTANFNTRVYEMSGAFSVDRYSLPFHPYNRYIGVRLPKGDVTRGMLLTDKKHAVDLMAVDQDGKPVKNARVKVELYKIRWRWWWEKEEEDLANYVGTSDYQPMDSDVVELKNGRGSWRFEVKYPQWGRFFVHVSDLEGNHNTGKIVYIDWPGWAGRAQAEGSPGANMLTFSADKEKYAVGDKITLNIPVAPQGRGVVCIEAGGKILSTEYFTPAASDQTYRYSFTAAAEMAPNIYAHVTYLQPHMRTGNDMPIRLYGFLPVMVENPATHLKPAIACTDVFKPESKAAVTVSERQGAAMTYTLAVVDEGLLGLTRYATPDPWDLFFKRQAIAVGTWDLYDYVAAAYGGKLEQLLAIGGGEGDLLPDKGRKAERFPPLVRFYGPFTLAAGVKRTHTVDIPLYVGAVRVMVVAGNGRAFGAAEKTVTVKKPLMVQGTLPRSVAVGEEFALPVAVFATEAKLKNVNVKVSVQGPVSIDGAAVQTIAFKEPGDGMLNFRLKAANRTGVASVAIDASGAGESISQKIEFDVRVPALPVVDVHSQAVGAGQTAVKDVALPGLPGTNEATLEVSRIPPLNLGKRLDFLIHYPYGCIEQTTSSVFPQLYLPKLLELSPQQAESVQRNVEAGISRLMFFQNSDGGFCYWPGAGKSDEWGSNYAGHFLLEAKRLAYHVPEAMLSQWRKYQKNRALNWSPGDESGQLTQAYRLYGLALNGTPEIGSMNRLRESINLSVTARWYLAAAYTLAGQKEAASQLTAVQRIVFRVYHELTGTYGSDLRDKAIVLETMSLMNNYSQADKLVQEISDALCRDDWLSTQATAYCLVAMARFAGVRQGDGLMKFSYAAGSAAPTSKQSGAPVMQIPLPVGNGANLRVTVANSGGQTLFVRVFAKGLPEPGREKPSANGLSLDVSYRGLKGEAVSIESLEQGTDLMAVITVRNSSGRALQTLALSALFPSGWEIHNLRMEGPGGAVNSPYDYLDVRDDRVNIFFDLARDETKTFQVLLNASYLGKFYLPIQSVEAMYDATIQSRLPGQWVTVVK